MAPALSDSAHPRTRQAARLGEVKRHSHAGLAFLPDRLAVGLEYSVYARLGKSSPAKLRCPCPVELPSFTRFVGHLNSPDIHDGGARWTSTTNNVGGAGPSARNSSWKPSAARASAALPARMRYRHPMRLHCGNREALKCPAALAKGVRNCLVHVLRKR